MAFSQEDLDRVNAAILALATGERVVSVTMPSGRSVQYAAADLHSLQALKSHIASELGQKRRTVYVSTEKGL